MTRTDLVLDIAFRGLEILTWALCSTVGLWTAYVWWCITP